MNTASAYPEIRVSVRAFDGDIVVARRGDVLDIGFAIPITPTPPIKKVRSLLGKAIDIVSANVTGEGAKIDWTAIRRQQAEAELSAYLQSAETGETTRSPFVAAIERAEAALAAADMAGHTAPVAEVLADNGRDVDELGDQHQGEPAAIELGRATNLDDETVFADGHRVGKDGGVRYNPHPEGSHERSVWDRGWEKGYLDFEKARAGAGQPGEENLDSYKEGVEAGRRGEKNFNNPYSSLGRDHGVWERGRVAGASERANHADGDTTEEETTAEAAESGAKEADGFVVLSATGMLGRYKKAGEPMKKVMIGHLGDIASAADVTAFAERNRVAIDALPDDKREEVLAAIEARRVALAEPATFDKPAPDQTDTVSDGQPVDAEPSTIDASEAEDVPLPLGDRPAAKTRARSLKVEPIKLAGGDIDWAATYAALRKSLTVIDDVDDLERWVADNHDLNGDLKANVPTWYTALEGFYAECRAKLVGDADGQAA